MRDRETDSWWPIMVGRAVGGPLEGSPLRELPGSEKATWGEWKRRHPNTLALVEDGRTHEPLNHCEGYFGSERTFRGMRAADDRLPAKEPVFAFRLGDRPFAIAHREAEGGVGRPGTASDGR